MVQTTRRKHYTGHVLVADAALIGTELISCLS